MFSHWAGFWPVATLLIITCCLIYFFIYIFIIICHITYLPYNISYKLQLTHIITTIIQFHLSIVVVLCSLLIAAFNILLCFCLQALCSGSLVSWGFFSPNGAALDHIRSLCQSGVVCICCFQIHICSMGAYIQVICFIRLLGPGVLESIKL